MQIADAGDRVDKLLPRMTRRRRWRDRTTACGALLTSELWSPERPLCAGGLLRRTSVRRKLWSAGTGGLAKPEVGNGTWPCECAVALS